MSPVQSSEGLARLSLTPLTESLRSAARFAGNCRGSRDGVMHPLPQRLSINSSVALFDRRSRSTENERVDDYASLLTALIMRHG